ncbi:hypothetical protein ACJRO7_020158 [Eucalyptus globulus]|uniref:Dephospho-CoA kinase n=1 Tax=Eucalyptus globulus TaxID=34317 RepID=A0ABD3KKS9_EUCGL
MQLIILLHFKLPLILASILRNHPPFNFGLKIFILCPRFLFSTLDMYLDHDTIGLVDGKIKKVVAAFGEEILQADGEVDRPKLGQFVFSDPAMRQVLNRLLAPYISSGIFQEILKLRLRGHKVIALDIPLLFEAKMGKWTRPILRRLMARDRTNKEDARNRMNAQMPLDLKRSKADGVIDNTGSLEDLNEPLTWTEFAHSRQGALLAFLSITVGVQAFRKASL